MKASPASHPLGPRARDLFRAHQQAICHRTDRLFANLMVIQWIAGITAALLISPQTWIGPESRTHLHVWAAIFLGGLITLLPVLLAWRKPGATATRHVIAGGQMLTSALLIHLSGGRIETHFHIFGSLAFLAMYRDWRVLLTATFVVTADHFFRGIFWPQSIFGILTPNSWRWVEHAGWVLFENTWLWIAIRQQREEMRDIATRRAAIEEGSARIEREVVARTAEVEEMARGLQVSEQRFRMLSDAAPIGIFEVDLAGKSLYTNLAWEEISGRDLAASEGEGWQTSLHPDDVPEITEEWTKAVISGAPFVHEHRFIKHCGEVRWGHVRAAPIRAGERGVIGYVGTVQDITDRRKADAELAKLHRKLLEISRFAGMAEVATNVLHNVGNVLNSTNISLEVATKKVAALKTNSLQRVSALLQENAGDLPAFFASHPQGLKLPDFLFRIATHCTEVREAALRELSALRGNIEHINRIITTQQNYASGGGVIEVVPLAEVIGHALHLNDVALGNSGARVLREIDPALPAISTDRHKILQILVNLIRNAKHALDDTVANERCLTVRAHVNGNRHVHISVADNGVGIAPENLRRIFEHGFTTKKTGHGFGLHSSALAAQQLGGALHVESAGPGRGATFTLQLPLSTTAS